VGRRRASRLPYRLGQSNKIITGWRGRPELPVVTHQFPPPGSGQANGMMLAEVVRMGFGVRREGTDDRS
jgi:hypothetical protein